MRKLWCDATDDEDSIIPTAQRSQDEYPLTTTKEADSSKSREWTHRKLLTSYSSGSNSSASLGTMIFNSFVIVQETALVCILFSLHNILRVTSSSSSSSPSVHNNNHEELNESQFFFFLAITCTLIIILFYSEGHDDYIAEIQKETSTVRRKTKSEKRFKRISTRLMDALLLAGILRFLSSLLRSLTASYSSDTVLALSITGMIFHLLLCDYDYANGYYYPEKQNNACNNNNLSSRPTFKGGTSSLNSALFSTTLLASRLTSDLDAFAFISSSIVAFAFYPAARHYISKQKNQNQSTLITNKTSIVLFCNPCTFITLSLCIAAVLALDTGSIISTQQSSNSKSNNNNNNDDVEYYADPRIGFCIIVLCICFIGPLVKWRLLKYKQIIRGPWDIAYCAPPSSSAPVSTSKKDS